MPFKPATIKITIDSEEEGEHFLQGLIVAKSNNSNPLFEELIEAVNAILMPARKERIESTQ